MWSRLLDELANSRVIDKELRTHVDIARSLFSTGSGEEERVACALSNPEAARLAAAWAPKKVLGSLQVFVDVKATPDEAESFCVAARAVSTLQLGACVDNPVARHLLDFYGVARAVALGAECFVDDLFREVSALRLG